jgi:hypothetical protein
MTSRNTARGILYTREKSSLMAEHVLDNPVKKENSPKLSPFFKIFITFLLYSSIIFISPF